MKRVNTYKNIAVFSTMFLAAFFAVYFYSPVVISHAASESSAGSEVNLNINASISLSASSDSVDMSTNINSFVHDTVDLTVITNSQYGYTLSIEDADANTNMVHEDSSITDVITSNFTGAKTSSTMDNNTWGWSTDSGANYYRIPELGLPTLVSKANGVIPNGTATVAVDFGAKVGLLTSGTYSDTVLFTAYTNGAGGLSENGTGVSAKGTKVDGVMQSFDCSTLATGNTVTLKDSRDNNTYTVAKLADGKCWMTQNLRIANRELTSTNSDVVDTVSLSKAINTDDIQRDLDALMKENPGLSDAEVNALASTRLIKIDETYGGYYAPIVAYGGASNYTKSYKNGEDFVVSTSICPKNWRLPIRNELITLGGLYGESLNAMLSEPISFKLAGYYEIENGESGFHGSFKRVGTAGVVITSDIKQDNDGVQALYFSDETASFFGASDMMFVTVRCVAR